MPVTKNCPECEQQVPIACRICPCGYSYANKGKTDTSQTSGETSISSSRPRRMITRLNRQNMYAPVQVRQTSKTKAAASILRKTAKSAKVEKPSSSKGTAEKAEEKPSTAKAKNQNSSEPSPQPSSSSPVPSDEPAKKRRGGRNRTASSGQDQDTGSQTSSENGSNSNGGSREDDMYSNITAEKVMQYSIILAEINRKYSAQNFKPT